MYHIMGPMDVGTQILFRRILFHGTPKEKFLARLQLMVNYLTVDLSQTNFISQIVGEVTPDNRKELGVSTWDEFIAEIKQAQGQVDVPRLKKMGMMDFVHDVAKLGSAAVASVAVDVNEQDRPVSPTAQHWGSKNFVLSPKSSGPSTSNQADTLLPSAERRSSLGQTL